MLWCSVLFGLLIAFAVSVVNAFNYFVSWQAQGSGRLRGGIIGGMAAVLYVLASEYFSRSKQKARSSADAAEDLAT